MSQWLLERHCDVLLAQEPLRINHAETVNLHGYVYLGGNPNLGVWYRQDLPPPALRRVSPFCIEIEIGYILAYNVYLSPYATDERLAQLNFLRQLLQRADDRPIIVMGDFNLAPCPSDGMFGEQVSSWTKPSERQEFALLLSSSRLVDATSSEAMSRQEYTIERLCYSKPIRFRCDLALVSDYLLPLVSVSYDHSSRIGDSRFTDHSAVIVDVPITLPMPTLFDSEPNQYDDFPNARVASYKTAIPRRKPSRIARYLVQSGLLKVLCVNSILDYGCGYGQDVIYYRANGYLADGYDPYPGFGWTDMPDQSYDIVLLVFVLNVLPNPWERLRVLRSASQFVKNPGGYILIATRSPLSIHKEASQKAWKPHNDGYWSHEARKTFQKGISKVELRSMLARVGFHEAEFEFPSSSETVCILARRT